jgi:hypothetical protein
MGPVQPRTSNEICRKRNPLNDSAKVLRQQRGMPVAAKTATPITITAIQNLIALSAIGEISFCVNACANDPATVASKTASQEPSTGRMHQRAMSLKWALRNRSKARTFVAANPHA